MVLHALHLCSGYGGFELALRGIARTVAHVERDAYAAATLVARMEEARLDRAPIWSDLTTFNARPWRGRVDIVTAGFPCPPFSAAGKRAGADDDRWLWPDIARIIRDIQPRMVFLENVPGVVSGMGERSGCVCGGAGGWRRVNHDSAQRAARHATVRAVLGRGDGRGQVGNVAQRVPFDLRRSDLGESAGQERWSPCGNGGVEAAWLGGSVRAGSNAARVAHQEAAGRGGSRVVSEGGRTASDGQRQAEVVSGAAERLAWPVRPGGALERPRRPATRGLCATCGRPVDDSGRRESVRASALGDVLWSLAVLGFDAEWGLLAASAVGAPHRRERFWLVGHADSPGRSEVADAGSAQRQGCGRIAGEPQHAGAADLGADVADTKRLGQPGQRLPLGGSLGRAAAPWGSTDVADAQGERWDQGNGPAARCRRPEPQDHRYPPAPNDHAGWAEWVAQGGPEPGVRRGADGPPPWLADALHLGGNGLVPQAARAAWELLTERGGWSGVPHEHA